MLRPSDKLFNAASSARSAAASADGTRRMLLMAPLIASLPLTLPRVDEVASRLYERSAHLLDRPALGGRLRYMVGQQRRRFRPEEYGSRASRRLRAAARSYAPLRWRAADREGAGDDRAVWNRTGGT